MGKKEKERKAGAGSPVTTLIVALVSSTIFFLIGVMVGREYAIREGIVPVKEQHEIVYPRQPRNVLSEVPETKGGEDQEKVDITFYDQLMKEGDQELSRGAAEEASGRPKSSSTSSEKKGTKRIESKRSKEISKGDYALQVAAFRDKNRAERMAQALKRAGFSSHILRVSIPGKPGSFYRVWVGYYPTVAEAARAKRLLLQNAALKISRATIVKR